LCIGPVDFVADFFSHMVLRFDRSRGNGGWWAGRGVSG
jgi:hypothetical protein